ncbi:MAG: integrase family protein [bacterium]|nr:MAG: integrase family protein [bacterium]
MQEKRLSPRTIRYANAVISSAFKQALKWRMLAYNPATLVELPRESSKEMQALSPEEAMQFLEAVVEDRFGLLLTFALITGMRPEEYLGLQWKDVDLQKGVVTIQRTVVWLPKGKSWSFGEPKTTKSRRSIPLPISIVQRLFKHKHKQLEERLKKGLEYQNYDLVFASNEGTPIMLRNLVRRHFKPALKRAELSETLRLYDLRHSCATLLLSENENPKVVSERLGHSRINITLDTYSHVLPSMQQAASDKLEKLLFSEVAHKRHTK